MRHKVRDLGVFFCFALMLFTVTSCGKEVSDQTIAATEQSSEERRDAEAVMGTETVETFSTEKAGWFCMQTLWRRRKNCLRTLWRFAWKAVFYLSWQGCDHGWLYSLSWSEEMYGMWRKRKSVEKSPKMGEQNCTKK